MVTQYRVMAFFTALTEAIASRQSLLVAGLDPNPEMLRHWASSRNLSGRSLLSQARAWCKAVIGTTRTCICGSWILRSWMTGCPNCGNKWLRAS